MRRRSLRFGATLHTRARCLARQETRFMPLLFYFPVIVMSGLYEAAADDMAQIYSFWFRPRE